MSKAFDTVNRKQFMTDLGETLEQDELHLLSIITNRQKLSVKLDDEIGEQFPTYVGICQGDCLSAVLFIFYLSCALKEAPNEQVPKDLQAFLEIFYADDLSFATTSYYHRESLEY